MNMFWGQSDNEIIFNHNIEIERRQKFMDKKNIKNLENKLKDIQKMANQKIITDGEAEEMRKPIIKNLIAYISK